MSTQNFIERVKSLKQEVKLLEDNTPPEHIETTASRLEGVNFTPPVITPSTIFVRLQKDGLLQEIERIVTMSDAEACALAPDSSKKCEDLRLQHITVLIFYYQKLLELRRGNVEEWDEIDELYIHD